MQSEALRYELGSEPWLAALRGEFLSALSEVELGGLNFSLCEEYLNPPAHLTPAGQATIGWHYRFVGGVFSLGDSVLSTADLHIRADWATVRELSKLTLTDPAQLAQYDERLQAALAAGALTVSGDPASKPAVLANLRLHDRMAALTA